VILLARLKLLLENVDNLTSTEQHAHLFSSGQPATLRRQRTTIVQNLLLRRVSKHGWHALSLRRAWEPVFDGRVCPSQTQGLSHPGYMSTACRCTSYYWASSNLRAKVHAYFTRVPCFAPRHPQLHFDWLANQGGLGSAVFPRFGRTHDTLQLCLPLRVRSRTSPPVSPCHRLR
jgi:hypothetical protein